MNQQIASLAKPDTQEDLIEQAKVYYNANDFDKARVISDELLRMTPQGYAAAHLAGVIATAQKRLPEAAEHLKQALRYAPDTQSAAVSWFSLGKALHDAHDLRQAEEAFRRAVRLNPSICNYYVELADVYSEGWKPELAIETLQIAIKRFFNDPVPCAALGNVLHKLGRHTDALIAYELAIKRNPDYASAHLSRGSMLKVLGRWAESEAAIREALRLDPMIRAYIQLVHFKKFTADDPEISEIKTRLSPERNAPLIARLDAMYGLAKVYDDMGDYETAFRYLEEASRLNRSTFDFSIAGYEQMVEGIMALFTPDFLARYSDKSASDLAPIFILGMPRSGTTLTEQILASHSQVQGGGELFFITQIAKQLGETWESRGESAPGDDATVASDLVQAAAHYQAMTAELWRKRPRITDKMPSNFFYIGVINLLFPKARIIYCRRNPVATCLSCFQNFFAEGNVLFSYDLTELGRFYKLHKRIMEHWQKVLPEQILEMEYETLVDSPEPGIRRILEFCNLAYEPACLNFHTLKRPVATASFMQVRKPIYKDSLTHWKNYQPFLGPLLDALGADAPV